MPRVWLLRLPMVSSCLWWLEKMDQIWTRIISNLQLRSSLLRRSLALVSLHLKLQMISQRELSHLRLAYQLLVLVMLLGTSLLLKLSRWSGGLIFTVLQAVMQLVLRSHGWAWHVLPLPSSLQVRLIDVVCYKIQLTEVLGNLSSEVQILLLSCLLMNCLLSKRDEHCCNMLDQSRGDSLSVEE